MGKLAIIGGTGLNDLAGATLVSSAMPNTLYGAISGVLDTLQLADKQFIFMPRHGRPHKVPPHKINYRANLAALKEAGVTQIIAINAVGGITPQALAGAIVIPHDLIDYTWGREHTYSDGLSDRLDHVDLSEPYTPRLREIIITAAQQLSLPIVPSGVYAVTQGPRLETPAEIAKYEKDGCDIVGMTGMPEAALARELGLDYACISLVVNPAAGKGDGEITMADIQRVLDDGMGEVRALLVAVIKQLA
jgi:5'-methylthioinosine phosphorylase